MISTLLSFYKSSEWEDFRKRIIAERTGEDGILRDEVTGEPILRKYDCILHHVEELTEDNWRDVTISLNPDNVKVVSFRTHNQLHKRGFCTDGKRENPIGLHKVYLVWGSPCAGKSTWVQSVAEDDDLIVDIDRVWMALQKDKDGSGNSGAVDKPWRIKDVVFDVYKSLLDCVRVRRGRWNACYIVAGLPLEAERLRLMEQLSVDRDIYIECDKSVCLERAKAKGDKWIEYVEQWWDRYTPPHP